MQLNRNLSANLDEDSQPMSLSSEAETSHLIREKKMLTKNYNINQLRLINEIRIL